VLAAVVHWELLLLQRSSIREGGEPRWSGRRMPRSYVLVDPRRRWLARRRRTTRSPLSLVEHHAAGQRFGIPSLQAHTVAVSSKYDSGSILVMPWLDKALVLG
jgi:hypothetical protein